MLGFTASQGSVRECQLDCNAVGQGQGEDVQIGQEVCQSISLRLEEGIHDFKGHHMSAKGIVNYSSTCSKLLKGVQNIVIFQASDLSMCCKPAARIANAAAVS